MPGKNAEGWGGRDFILHSKSVLYAIDYQTGKVRWTRDMTGSRGGFAGTLATAGHLVFTANDSGMLMALDPATGKTLWHTYGGGGSTTAPMTYRWMAMGSFWGERCGLRMRRFPSTERRVKLAGQNPRLVLPGKDHA